MWRGCRSFLLPYRYGCLHELALTRSRFCTRKRFTSFIRCEEQHRVLDAILHFFHSLFNPDGLRELIRAGGAPLICTILFIETGFFVGFFLPGDSLLVTAGILSAGGVIPLRWLLIPVMLCAIVGDQIGYWIGRTAGAALYLLVLFPLFEPSALPSPGPQRCPTPVIWLSTFLAGFFGSAP